MLEIPCIVAVSVFRISGMDFSVPTINIDSTVVNLTLFHESRLAGKPYGTYILRTKVVRIYFSKFCLSYYYILHYVCGSTMAGVHINRVSPLYLII